MKFKSLILCSTLAMCFTATAQVTGDHFTSSDSDGSRVSRTSAITAINKDMSVGYANTVYKNNTDTYSADELKLILDIKRNNYLVTGELGIINMSPNSYVSSDINATKKLNENVDLTAGIYTSIVDSANGLAKGISVTGTTAGAEYQSDIGGVVGSIRVAQFTNSNTQTGFMSKVYVNITDGVNVYVATKQYSNSSPNNGDYFSPDNYKRYVLGIGFRKKISDVTVSGYYEKGTSLVDQVNAGVDAWRISVDTPFNKRWTSGVAAGTDTSNSSNYKYEYVKMYVTYTF